MVNNKIRKLLAEEREYIIAHNTALSTGNEFSASRYKRCGMKIRAQIDALYWSNTNIERIK